MAKQIIGLGSAANDGTGDTLRSGGTKINANFTEVYAAIAPTGGAVGSVLTKNTTTDYDYSWTAPATPSGLAPTAGTTGQVLAKVNNTNYNYTWTTIVGLAPTSGTTGQVLTKNTNTSYDYSWVTPTGSGVQNNFSATTSPIVTSDSNSGYAAGSSWLNINTAEMWRCRDATVGSARWVKIDVADHPGYVAGRYYSPFGQGSPITSGALAANTMYLAFGVIKERITISSLGVRVTTLGAGNFQAAIYNHIPSTGMPGTLVNATGSGSTGAVGVVNAALTSNSQLEPGHYWFALELDNTTAVILSQGASSTNHSSLIGSSVAAIGAVSSMPCGFTLGSNTFGNWPDLTSASLTELTTARGPLIQLLVASVP